MLYVAYLWYRSQIQSRDSRADVSHARGIPQSSAPKCEVDSRAGVDCRIPRERSFPLSLFYFFSFLLFFFLFLQLANCGKQKQAALRRLPPGRWLARLHKYYANIRSGPVRPRARTRETVTFLLSCATPRRSTRKVSLLISTEICATRVSPLSPRDSLALCIRSIIQRRTYSPFPAPRAFPLSFLSAVLFLSHPIAPFSIALSFLIATALLLSSLSHRV